MLDIIKVIILGIVEGITEWLPVSSTGHLILVGNVLKPSMSDAFMEMFDVVIQLGAIMAVVVFTKKEPQAEDADLADVDQGTDRIGTCRNRRSSVQ